MITNEQYTEMEVRRLEKLIEKVEAMEDRINRDDVLVVIMEECSELAKEAAKCYRFGLEASEGWESHLTRLAEEMGDLRYVVDMLYESLGSERREELQIIEDESYINKGRKLQGIESL